MTKEKMENGIEVPPHMVPYLYSKASDEYALFLASNPPGIFSDGLVFVRDFPESEKSSNPLNDGEILGVGEISAGVLAVKPGYYGVFEKK